MGDDNPDAAAPPTTKVTATAEESMISVSTSLPPALHELVKKRGDQEDRTMAVVVRRAVKAYMKGWQPGEDDDD